MHVFETLKDAMAALPRARRERAFSRHDSFWIKTKRRNILHKPVFQIVMITCTGNLAGYY